MVLDVRAVLPFKMYEFSSIFQKFLRSRSSFLLLPRSSFVFEQWSMTARFYLWVLATSAPFPPTLFLSLCVTINV
jgi:hypothetical protein